MVFAVVPNHAFQILEHLQQKYFWCPNFLGHLQYSRQSSSSDLTPSRQLSTPLHLIALSIHRKLPHVNWSSPHF